ncbi:MAG: hypothetical protein QXS29_10580 [Nitrososphaeria archaeon]
MDLELLELTETERNHVREINKKVIEYLNKNNATFEKDKLMNFTVKVYGSLGSLDNENLVGLVVKNLEDLTFLHNQSIAVKLALDYLKLLKENYANKFRYMHQHKSENKSEKRMTLSDIERELSVDPVYIAIKYLILLYESNYFSRVLSNLEIVRTYRDILNKELAIRIPNGKNGH